MVKVHNYELLQHFTYPEPNSFPSVSLCILCAFTFRIFSFLCTSHSFQHESTLHSFLFVFFFCTSLICFCSFFILFQHIINHNKFLQLNVIHSQGRRQRGGSGAGSPFDICSPSFHVWSPGCCIHPMLYFKNVAPHSGFWPLHLVFVPPCC